MSFWSCLRRRSRWTKKNNNSRTYSFSKKDVIFNCNHFMFLNKNIKTKKIFKIILRLLERISIVLKRRRGHIFWGRISRFQILVFGKNIKISNIGVREEYQVVVNFIDPCWKTILSLAVNVKNKILILVMPWEVNKFNRSVGNLKAQICIEFKVEMKEIGWRAGRDWNYLVELLVSEKERN